MSFDSFKLIQKYQILLIFDCPTTDSQLYDKLHETFQLHLDQAAIIFSDNEMPTSLQQLINERNQQQDANKFLNIHSTYDTQLLWMTIGMFLGGIGKQIHIFTDMQEIFTSKLQLDNPESQNFKNIIHMHKCNEAQEFNIEKFLNPWNNFENTEVLSTFEIQQLRCILKKFIKQVVTSKPPNNLEKLLHISQNLVQAHLQSISKEKYKIQSDLVFHFIRSLFLDKVLENTKITNAILNNQIQNINDFENFTKIGYTQRFQDIIDKIKQQIQQKQQEQLQQQQLLSYQKELETQSIQEVKKEELKLEQEDTIIKQAIQALFDQYLSLFHKAKIFEIKKLPKLIKAIANYITGYIMKKETSSDNTKEKIQAHILQNNQQLICANIMKIIIKFGLIKLIDTNSIEHVEKQVIQDLLHNPQKKQIKEDDFIFDKQQAKMILEQPTTIFKTEKEKEREKEKEKEEQMEQQKVTDPYDVFIDKLLNQMRHSQIFPKTLKELEKLIEKHIVKKGEPQKDEYEIIMQIMKKMNKKGMFTQKQRTGESKEHAKDPKLKNLDIVELYKKEKGDIPIVFESSYSQNKQ